jgi:ParB family transcriptional regulator, chromosome partitioning protein
MHDIRLIPLDDIDDHALLRDRSHLNADALAELKASLKTNGLRLPVELIPAPSAHEGNRSFALLSGLRRITAWRELAAEGGATAIPALVRDAMSDTAALAAIIEENEMREPLSAWERGRIVWIAHDEGLFGTLEEAAKSLFPAASKVKLSRIRAIARAVEALGAALNGPELYSLRQCLRLASAVRAGFAPVMQAALADDPDAPSDIQWRIVLAYVEEAEALPEDAKPIGTRPVRLQRPRRGLEIRREKTKAGWSLHFAGEMATDGLMDRTFWEIERLIGIEEG